MHILCHYVCVHIGLDVPDSRMMVNNIIRTEKKNENNRINQIEIKTKTKNQTAKQTNRIYRHDETAHTPMLVWQRSLFIAIDRGYFLMTNFVISVISSVMFDDVKLNEITPDRLTLAWEKNRTLSMLKH